MRRGGFLAAPPRPVVPPDAIVHSEDFESLRWFPLPSEIVAHG